MGEGYCELIALAMSSGETRAEGMGLALTVHSADVPHLPAPVCFVREGGEGWWVREGKLGIYSTYLSDSMPR